MSFSSSLQNSSEMINGPVQVIEGLKFSLSGGEIGSPINTSSRPAFSQQVTLGATVTFEHVPADGGIFLVTLPGGSDPDTISQLYADPISRSGNWGLFPQFLDNVGPLPMEPNLLSSFSVAENYVAASVQSVKQEGIPLQVGAGQNDLSGLMISAAAPELARRDIGKTILMERTAPKGSVREDNISGRQQVIYAVPSEPSDLSGPNVTVTPTFTSFFNNSAILIPGDHYITSFEVENPTGTSLIPEFYSGPVDVQGTINVSYTAVPANTQLGPAALITSYWAYVNAVGNATLQAITATTHLSIANAGNVPVAVSGNFSIQEFIAPPRKNCVLIAVQVVLQTPMAVSMTVRMCLKMYSINARDRSTVLVSGIKSGYRGNASFRVRQNFLGQPTSELLRTNPDLVMRPVSSTVGDSVRNILYNSLGHGGTSLIMDNDGIKRLEGAIMTRPGLGTILRHDGDPLSSALVENLNAPRFESLSWSDLFNGVKQIAQVAAPVVGMYNPIAGTVLNSVGRLQSSSGRFQGATARFQGMPPNPRYFAMDAEEPKFGPYAPEEQRLKRKPAFKPITDEEALAWADGVFDKVAESPDVWVEPKPTLIAMDQAEVLPSGMILYPPDYDPKMKRPIGCMPANLINTPNMDLTPADMEVIRRRTYEGEHPATLGYDCTPYDLKCMDNDGDYDWDQELLDQGPPAKLTKNKGFMPDSDDEDNPYEEIKVPPAKAAAQPKNKPQGKKKPDSGKEVDYKQEDYDRVYKRGREDPSPKDMKELMIAASNGYAVTPYAAGMGPYVCAQFMGRQMKMMSKDNGDLHLSATEFLTIDSMTNGVVSCTMIASHTPMWVPKDDPQYLAFLRKKMNRPQGQKSELLQEAGFEEEVAYRYHTPLSVGKYTVYFDLAFVPATVEYLATLIQAFPSIAISTKTSTELYFTIDAHDLVLRNGAVGGKSCGLAFVAAMMGCPTGFVLTGEVALDGTVKAVGGIRVKSASYEGDEGKAGNRNFFIFPAANADEYTTGELMLVAAKRLNFEYLIERRMFPISQISDLYSVYTSPFFQKYVESVDPTGELMARATRWQKAWRQAVAVSSLKAQLVAVRKGRKKTDDAQTVQKTIKRIADIQQQIASRYTSSTTWVEAKVDGEDYSQLKAYDDEMAAINDKVAKSKGTLAFAVGGKPKKPPTFTDENGDPVLPKGKVARTRAKQEFLADYDASQKEIVIRHKIDPLGKPTPDNLTNTSFLVYTPKVVKVKVGRNAKQTSVEELEAIRDKAKQWKAKQPLKYSDDEEENENEMD